MSGWSDDKTATLSSVSGFMTLLISCSLWRKWSVKHRFPLDPEGKGTVWVIGFSFSFFKKGGVLQTRAKEFKKHTNKPEIYEVSPSVVNPCPSLYNSQCVSASELCDESQDDNQSIKLYLYCGNCYSCGTFMECFTSHKWHKHTSINAESSRQ